MMTVEMTDEIGSSEAEGVIEMVHKTLVIALLRWPGRSSAALRYPAPLAVRPLHPCSGVRRHAAHPCTRPAMASSRRDSNSPSGLRPLRHPVAILTRFHRREPHPLAEPILARKRRAGFRRPIFRISAYAPSLTEGCNSSLTLSPNRRRRPASP